MLLLAAYTGLIRVVKGEQKNKEKQGLNRRKRGENKGQTSEKAQKEGYNKRPKKAKTRQEQGENKGKGSKKILKL
jgi:hypothetical protein